MQITTDKKNILLRELILLCKKNIPNARIDVIQKAFEYAAKAHETQVRSSREPAFSHPVAVAKILSSELPLDDVCVISALLHDVVEDNKDYTIEMIGKEFGEEIAVIVSGLTKIKNLYKGSDVTEVENYRKLLMSIIKDFRVIIVKFADRLNNMRTLEFLETDKRKRIAKETMDVYAPLAHRFGLGRLKWELEDLAFKELNRPAYEELKKKVNAKRHEREQYIDAVIKPISDGLNKYNFQYEIFGRAKHLYSIFRKMIKRNKPFEEIYDLFAIRIILDTDDKNLCYVAMGVVNDLFPSVPDRFKDYLHIPKDNNYQSIHLTNFGPNGIKFETQVRTRKMHEYAEQGVAAHWRYKEGNKNEKDKTMGTYIAFVRDLLENLFSDSTEKEKVTVDNFKMSIYSEEIYVFTPRGEVKHLPVGSTPVDFAYAIHSRIGETCIGAKINGKIMPLDTPLNSSDQVEIITSKNQKPTNSWLKFVKTNKARSEIKKYVNREDDKFFTDGKEKWEKKLKKMKLSINQDELNRLIQSNKFENLRAFFKALGQGKISVEDVLKAEKETEKKTSDMEVVLDKFTKVARSTVGTIELVGHGEESGLKITFAKCCNPVPGDPIAAFVSMLEGLKVHRKNCKNLKDLAQKDPEKIREIRWPQMKDDTFMAAIMIKGQDSPGILQEISHNIVSYQNTNIKSISIDTVESSFFGNVTIFVRDIEHLNRIMDRLKKIKNVNYVNRLEL